MLLSLCIDLLLLAVVLCVLLRFLIFHILKLLLLVLQLCLYDIQICLARLIELREALKGFAGHVIDLLTLHVHICLAFSQIAVELVYFVESAHLSLLVVDYVLLLFLDVVHRGLDL